MSKTDNNQRQFIGDILGGLAAMLVALPSAIAFGVLIYTAIDPSYAGAGALAGMLGAAAMGFVAPYVSRNGGFITAPCAPAAAVMSALAIKLSSSPGINAFDIIRLMAYTALLAAGLQVCLGLFRAGRLIKFIPYQVVSGYLSGVAVIIAISQLAKLLGLPKNVTVAHGLMSPHLWNWTGILVGLGTIVAMILAPRLTQKIPATIIGLIAGLVIYQISALFNLQLYVLNGNSLVIGNLKATGSVFSAMINRWEALFALQSRDIPLIWGSALTLAVLLSIDTLKTGIILDALTHRRHNSNRELIGQGVANTASFFCGGIPGAGTMGATLVNVTSGGRSFRSGMAEGIFVLIAFFFLGGLIAWVPIGALAGILLVVVYRMFDWHMFHLLMRPGTRLDFVVIITVVIVAQIGLILASAVGIAFAILLFIRDQIHTSVIINKHDLRELHSKQHRLDIEYEILKRVGHQAYVVQLQGNLFFGTTDQLFSELENDLKHCRFLLLDMRRVQSIDFTAGQLFQQIQARLHNHNGRLLFCGMPSKFSYRQNIEKYLEQLGLICGDQGIKVFNTRDSGITWMEDQLLAAEGWRPQEEKLLPLDEIELFKTFDAKTLRELSSYFKTQSFSQGKHVCNQGEEGKEIYFIRRGRVHILLPLEGGIHHHLATFSQGDFFGEMAFLDREKRSADTVAAVDTDLYILTRESFDNLARKNPTLTAKIFEEIAFVVSNRLRIANQELHSLEER